MKNTTLLVVAIALIAVGAVGLVATYALGPGRPPTGRTPPGRYSSAGERIFQSGLDAAGNPIPRSSLPVSEGFLMMGGGGCASCHSSDGRGGAVSMMMRYIEAPDVTYDALVKEGFESDAAIRRAIVEGLDEDGEPLDAMMPRWKLRGTEANDVISYLKELSDR